MSVRERQESTPRMMIWSGGSEGETNPGAIDSDRHLGRRTGAGRNRGVQERRESEISVLLIEAEDEKRAGPLTGRGRDQGGETQGPHLAAHGREQALLASQKRMVGRTAQERGGVKTGTARSPGGLGRCVTVSRSLRILAHEASVE